jgi:hypothetical protein
VYEYNHGFEVVYGEPYFDHGKLIPPPAKCTDRVDKTYRTKAGGISHNGKIHAASDQNTAKAMSRLLKCRGTLAEELKFQIDQKNFLSTHQHVLDDMRKIYEPYFEDWAGAEEECHQHYDDPHPKRDLRMQAYDELVHGEGRSWKDPGLFSRMWLRKVTYKMKKDEFAKPGKMPRMIGDLGVAASLQGFRLTDLYKTAMSKEDLQYGNMRIHFCKAPTTVELRAAFKNLLDPPLGCKYYFVYFSDDSCLSVRHADGSVSIYNLDISGCDGSHTSAVFDALVSTTPAIAQADMQVLVDQCKLPIVIYFNGEPERAEEIADAVSLSSDSEVAGRASICLQPLDVLTQTIGPRLYSGSTITTIINNLACVLGAISVQESNAETGDEICAAFANVGYKMTCEKAEDYSDIQFLKNSPAYDVNGELQPLLNIGVLLRTAGTCKGDLPGTKRQTFEARYNEYMGSVLNGMYPGISFPLVDAMRKWTATPTKASDAATQHLRDYKHVFEGEATFTASEVYRRYKLNDLEIAELDQDFAPNGYGWYYASSGASKILTKDYGLECCDNWETDYAINEYDYR